MLTLRKPTDAGIRCFLEEQAKLEFTYAAVGATANEPPAGYVVDHTRVELGEGGVVFRAACAALRRREQFRLGWVDAVPAETPIRVGANIAVVARASGVWAMNASRIAYVVDEAGPITRFGFAYGTLPDHVETGEERFLIEWDRADNRVYYDILAFSRPRHVLARLGYPMVRRMQKKFGRDSVAAMLRAVAT